MIGSSFAAEPPQPAKINRIADGRFGAEKQKLLKRFGGTAETEKAVELGLRWLVKQQLPDGGWSLRKPYRLGADIENRCAATAFALLAMQGYGITHQPDPQQPASKEFQPVVKKGWEYLLKQQAEDGGFSAEDDKSQIMYAHGICTIAICELYAMTKDEAFKKPAQQAIKFCLEAQNPQMGGWRYTPKIESDTSVTGWVASALLTARDAGLDVPAAAFDNVTRYLDSAQKKDGSEYSYVPNRPSTPAMSAAGLLLRQQLGWKKDHPQLVQGVETLLNRNVDLKNTNVYSWYYTTLACRNLEGEPWKKWNAAIQKRLLGLQIDEGKVAGSWDSENDDWGYSNGRLFTTCFSILILESYYRHLPLYE